MMKKLITIFFLFLLIPLNIKAAENKKRTLEQEFKRLIIDTALIAPSQGIDDYPLWSKDGKSLAVNIMGEWYEIDLTNIELILGSWRDDQMLGVLNSPDSASIVEESRVLPWRNHNNFKPRSFQSKNGTIIELKQEGMSTVFNVKINGKDSKIIWTSTYDNCHSIVPSPEEKYIAFICEMNGVFVYKIPQK